MNELGRKAEALVQQQIEASGWHHIAVSQFQDGQAPMIRGENGDRIRPDFSVAKSGQRVWIEVKGKSEAVPFNGIPRHGIDLYNWEEYNRVADLTSDACWLFVYEKSTGLLLCRDLAELPVADERIKESYGADDPYGNDMVFFNKTDFEIKKIAQSHYPDSFFGQDKLPIQNVVESTQMPLFPNSSLGDSEQDQNRQLTEFATDGGHQ